MAGYIFTSEEAKRVANAVKANEGRPHTRLPPRPRPYRGTGGGGSSCTTQFAIWISGRPTGGSFSFPVTISGSPETITLNWDAEGEAPDDFDPMTDDVADYIDTAFAEHTEIEQADVTVTTPGGSFPYQVLRFSIANASSEVLIGNQTDSFTGGSSPYTTIDKCCG